MKKLLVLFTLILLTFSLTFSVFANEIAVRVNDRTLTEEKLEEEFDKLNSSLRTDQKGDNFSEHVIVSNFIKGALVRELAEDLNIDIQETKFEVEKRINEAAQAQGRNLAEYSNTQGRTYEDLVEDVTTNFLLREILLNYEKKAKEPITEEQINNFLDEVGLPRYFEGTVFFGSSDVTKLLLGSIGSVKGKLLFHEAIAEIYNETEIEISDKYSKEKVINSISF